MGFFTTYILIQNFETESKDLVFNKFRIIRIDNSNWDKCKEIFRPVSAKRVGQHLIERRYKEVPKMRREKSGTTHYCFSGENFKKKLRRLESKFQVPKFKCQGGEACL
jgi:hypothetical protein